ncbi:unnamed protein product [Prorocentrum cordatum]|uniref:Uncharacterized protein n=1 Tax=Prorocentrum cordatum TaxID=2364126 RepID=A0ABN9TR27_9DINO|nr:unnamed protein product [Polarella glacialis]
MRRMREEEDEEEEEEDQDEKEPVRGSGARMAASLAIAWQPTGAAPPPQFWHRGSGSRGRRFWTSAAAPAKKLGQFSDKLVKTRWPSSSGGGFFIRRTTASVARRRVGEPPARKTADDTPGLRTKTKG